MVEILNTIYLVSCVFLGYATCVLKIWVEKIYKDLVSPESDPYRSFLYELEENGSSELLESYKDYFDQELKIETHLFMNHESGHQYYKCGQSMDRIIGEGTRDISKVTCKKCLKIAKKEAKDLFPENRY